jgi:multiple sugar transport system substrate-binding protein
MQLLQLSRSAVTRRSFVASLGILAMATPFLAACAGQSAAPAPTAAAANSSSSASAAKPAPTTAPSQGKVTLSITTRLQPIFQWQKHFAKQWEAKHPNVDLKLVQIPYGNMAQKQLTELATGTLQDVVYSGVKWFPYSTVKGCFLELDDLTESTDIGLSDFFPAALDGCKLNGKLYGLPQEFQTGNQNIMLLNENIFQEKGIPLPTDAWTTQDFAQLAAKLTDKSKNIYGTSYLGVPATYYDFAALARTWGGDVLSSDRKTFTLATDPKAVAAAQWVVDLRTKHHAAPLRAQASGISFPAGQVAIGGTGLYAVLSTGKTIGNRFKWSSVLFPTGPTGLRGYEAFIVIWSLSSKTKQPELAFDLANLFTSKEVGVWAVVNNSYQPNSRQSVWADPSVQKASPIFSRVLAWMTNGKDKGVFPEPYNLRFSELEDKWENVVPSWLYGEVPFEQGLKSVQDACNAIMQESRPS